MYQAVAEPAQAVVAEPAQQVLAAASMPTTYSMPAPAGSVPPQVSYLQQSQGAPAQHPPPPTDTYETYYVGSSAAQPTTAQPVYTAGPATTTTAEAVYVQAAAAPLVISHDATFAVYNVAASSEQTAPAVFETMAAPPQEPAGAVAYSAAAPTVTYVQQGATAPAVQYVQAAAAPAAAAQMVTYMTAPAAGASVAAAPQAAPIRYVLPAQAPQPIIYQQAVMAEPAGMVVPPTYIPQVQASIPSFVAAPGGLTYMQGNVVAAQEPAGAAGVAPMAQSPSMVAYPGMPSIEPAGVPPAAVSMVNSAPQAAAAAAAAPAAAAATSEKASKKEKGSKKKASKKKSKAGCC